MAGFRQLKAVMAEPWGEDGAILTTAVRVFRAGYEVREQRWASDGLGVMAGRFAYNPSGDYIGTPAEAHYLVVRRGIAPELADPEHQVCSIGYCAREGKWYGWSHRAIHGFAPGDEFAPDDIGGELLPGFRAETMEGAKVMAMAFAAEVG